MLVGLNVWVMRRYWGLSASKALLVSRAAHAPSREVDVVLNLTLTLLT